jgi:DNA-binding HxlR family transcriptional regulator
MTKQEKDKYSLDCAITYTISIFEGKWKWLIIWVFSDNYNSL